MGTAHYLAYLYDCMKCPMTMDTGAVQKSEGKRRASVCRMSF